MKLFLLLIFIIFLNLLSCTSSKEENWVRETRFKYEYEDLKYAICTQNLDVAVRILNESPSFINKIDSSFEMKSTLLFAMNYLNDYHSPEFVDILVEKGANVSVTDTKGYTPLHYAVRIYNVLKEGAIRQKITPYIDIQIVKTLISKGADVNARAAGDLGITPLFCAIQDGYIEVIEFMVLNGADVNMKCKIEGIEYLPSQYAEKIGRINLSALLKKSKIKF